MIRVVSLTLLAALGSATPALAADGAAGHQRASPIQASARVEVARLPGDDAVFDDFVAEFNGAVVGGIGAAAGASAVAIVQAARKQERPTSPAPG